MVIWLIYPYGSIPGEGLRPDRPNMVARALADAGHEVTWFGSSFEHRNKIMRSDEWKEIKFSDKNTTRLVPTSGYVKNISFDRIRSEKEYARQIYLNRHKYAMPEMIIMAEPSVFISGQVVKIIKEFNTLFLLDMGDLWPELFHLVLPKKLNILGKLIFSPFYARRRSLFQKADAIIALSDSYRVLARKIASNLPDEFLQTVYYGMDVGEQRTLMNKSSDQPEPLREIKKADGELWAIYASTLGNNYDLKTLLEAAIIIEQKAIKIKILIAGDGPMKDYMVSFIKENDLKQVVYIGNPNSATIAAIFSFCDIGLSMYIKNSTVTMPIKAFHYFAAGLPVINSLKGDLANILSEHNIGLNYEPENVQSFVNALETIASDPLKLREMAKNSYELATTFDIDVQYKKFSNIVDKMAQKKAHLSQVKI